MKKLCSVFLVALVAGTMVSADIVDAAVRRGTARSRTVAPRTTPTPVPLTKPAPTTTAPAATTAPATTAAPAATAPRTTTSTPTASQTPATTAAPATSSATAAPAAATPSSSAPTQNFGQAGQPYSGPAPTQYAAPAQSQGSGIGGALLGAGAGVVGGYLLGNALSGSDVANAAQSAADTAAAGVQSAASGVQSAAANIAGQPASPVTNLLGYNTESYCTQLAQGNAATKEQCTAAENAAMTTLRGCVTMSTGLNGIGSYDALLRCLRATPAAAPAAPAAQ